MEPKADSLDSLTDTHCHLDFKAFAEDLEEVIQRARSVGVERMLIPGVDLDSCRHAHQIARSHPGVYTAVGIHPNDLVAWDQATADEIRQLASQPDVVAIGEIGLDYYWDKTEPALQKEGFYGQLMIAADLGLPVIIHQRDSIEDVLKILTEWHYHLVEFGSKLAERPGVLHSFSASYESATAALGLGFYIGLTGPITFKKTTGLQEVVARLSLDRILIETDSPFLTPEPHRGRRNEPSNVQYVAQKIAQLHERDYEDVSLITSRNAKELFQW